MFVVADGTLAFVAVDGDEIVGWCCGYFLPPAGWHSDAYLTNSRSPSGIDNGVMVAI